MCMLKSNFNFNRLNYAHILYLANIASIRNINNRYGPLIFINKGGWKFWFMTFVTTVCNF